MAIQAAIALATSLLEHDDVLTLDEGSLYLAHYFGTFYGRCTHCHSTVGVYEQHAVKFYRVAFFTLVAEIVNIQLLASLGAELLSLNFYNCVH